MHHQVVILQEFATQAFTSIAVKVGDLDNEVFLADVKKLFVECISFNFIVTITTAFAKGY